MRNIIIAIAAICLAQITAYPGICADLHCTPAQPWSATFGIPPRIAFVGDVDADGYADLISVQTAGPATIDISLNSKGIKCSQQFTALDGLGAACIGAVGGEFDKNNGTDVLAVFYDDSVRIACSYDKEKRRYSRSFDVGRLPVHPGIPLYIVCGDVYGDGQDDVIVTEVGGRTWLILPNKKIEAIRQIGLLGQGIQGIWLAHNAIPTTTYLVYQDADGTVWKRSFEKTKNTPDAAHITLGKRSKIVSAEPGCSICCGDFDGDGKSDIIVGTKVIWGDSSKENNDWQELATSEPGILFAGDMNGDGRDDLVRFRRGAELPGKEPYTEFATYVHYVYDDRCTDSDNDGLSNSEEMRLGTDPRNRDTDGDGLLDGWEVNGFGGVDMPGFGCSPLFKDVICEIQPIGLNANQVDELKYGIRQANDFFSAQPILNPNNKRGVHLISILHEKIDSSNANWESVYIQQFPACHKGICHWMMVGPGGGGQSRQLGDAGRCGVDKVYYTFLHELGHQFGLDHGGFWNAQWCPIYPSLMNYAYSYMLEGRADAVRYSKGIFGSLRLNETDLSEVLPYPAKYLDFLSQPPHGFRLKPDGNNTLIDWNWNGIFGEKHVRADINYAYGANAGARTALDKCCTSPLLTRCGTELLLIYGKRGRNNSTDLVCRRYEGDKHWSEPFLIDNSRTLGDISAASDGRSTWIFYLRNNAITFRSLTCDKGKLASGKPRLMPDSAGAFVTPCFYQDRLYVFVSRPDSNQISVRRMESTGWSAEEDIGIESKCPIGAGMDPAGKYLLIVACNKPGREETGSSRLIRYKLNGSDMLQLVDVNDIKGFSGSERPTIIAGDESDKLPPLTLFGAGTALDSSSKHFLYAAAQVRDKTVNGGWIIKRLYDEWTQCGSAPTAARCDDDIAIAYRANGSGSLFSDNDLVIAYNGSGIEDEQMGDFDDLRFIQDIGLQYSILEVQ